MTQEKKDIDIKYVLVIYTQQIDKMHQNPCACEVINSGDVSFQETVLSSQKLWSGLVH